jgi:hypothetical protein
MNHESVKLARSILQCHLSYGDCRRLFEWPFDWRKLTIVSTDSRSVTNRSFILAADLLAQPVSLRCGWP